MLTFRVNKAGPAPLAFRAFRRLVNDGDFNADVPVGQLKPGPNTVTIEAVYRDGQVVRKDVTLVREAGWRRLPLRIEWRSLKDISDAGQAVDGHWAITPEGCGRGRSATTGVSDRRKELARLRGPDDGDHP